MPAWPNQLACKRACRQRAWLRRHFGTSTHCLVGAVSTFALGADELDHRPGPGLQRVDAERLAERRPSVEIEAVGADGVGAANSGQVVEEALHVNRAVGRLSWHRFSHS